MFNVSLCFSEVLQVLPTTSLQTQRAFHHDQQISIHPQSGRVLFLLAHSAFVLVPPVKARIAQATVVLDPPVLAAQALDTVALDFPMWTWTAYLAFAFVSAMNASITQTAVQLDSPMLAALTLYAVVPEFTMWTWIAFLATALQPPMWARTANSTTVFYFAMLTTNALPFLRSTQLRGRVVICRGQATLHREQKPMLFATYLEIMIGRIQFQELAEQGVENLQGWMNLGISQIQVIQA